MRKTELTFWIFVCAMLLISCSKSYEQRLKECDEVGDFHDGLALCLQDGKCFYINADGDKMSEEYDGAWDYKNGYAVVFHRTDDGDYIYRILDKDCNELSIKFYAFEGPVTEEGNLWVSTSPLSGYGFSDTGTWRLLKISTGELLTEAYHRIDCVDSDGTAVVSNVHKDKNRVMEFAMVSGNGDVLIPLRRFSFIGNIHNGMAQYSTLGYYRWPSIVPYEKDKEERNSIPTRSSMEYAPMGYVNTKGQVVIEAEYMQAGHFNDAGFAEVATFGWGNKFIGKKLIIDKQGHILDGQDLIDAKATF